MIDRIRSAMLSLFAVSLAMSASGCDREDPVRGAPPLPSATGDISEPAPAMRSGLVENTDGAFWFPGDRRGDPRACMSIDNGTAAAARIVLPDGASLEVPAAARRRLCSFDGELAFTAHEGAVELALTASLAADRLTVYNVGAAWDYVVVERMYNQLAVGAGDERTEIVEALLFDVAAVDHELEPLPETLEVQLGPDEVLPTRSLRQLDRLGAVHPDRRVTALQHASFAALVVDGDGSGASWAVQSRRASDRATLIIDNPASGSLEATLDGVALAEIGARSWVRVLVPAGPHRLVATRAGKPIGMPQDAELLAGTRHLWEPSARQRYAIDRMDYGVPVVATLGGNTAVPLDDRGFFEVTSDYIFDPFPPTIESAYGIGTQRTRLLRQR